MAVNANASNIAAQPANAAPDTGDGQMFASLVAGQMPQKDEAAQATPHGAQTPSKDDPSPKTQAAKALAKKAAAKIDPAALAALAMPPTQTVPPKPANDIIGDATAKTAPVNAAQLRALATKMDGPANPAAPAGTPQTPAAGNAAPAKTDSDSKAVAQAPDMKALAAAPHESAKQPATAAQALSLRVDAKPGATQNNSGNPQGQDQRGNDSTPQQPQTAQASAAAPATTAAPAITHAASPAATASVAPVQQNMSAQQSAPVAANLHVSTAAQQANTQADIGAIALTIAARSQDGIKHFDIRLDPPEMGRIDVRLSVDDSGRAQAHLAADKPQTLQMLQRDSGTLERALKDAGLNLSNNGLNFSLKGEQRQADSGARTQTRSRTLSLHAVAAPETTAIRSFAPGSTTLDITV